MDPQGSRGLEKGLFFEGPEGQEISYAVRLTFTTTNNQAEYGALIVGLELAKAVKADKVKTELIPN